MRYRKILKLVEQISEQIAPLIAPLNFDEKLEFAEQLEERIVEEHGACRNGEAVPFWNIDSRFGPIEARILRVFGEAYEGRPLLYRSRLGKHRHVGGYFAGRNLAGRDGHRHPRQEGEPNPNPHKKSRRSLRKRLAVRISQLNDKLCRSVRLAN